MLFFLLAATASALDVVVTCGSAPIAYTINGVPNQALSIRAGESITFTFDQGCVGHPMQIRNIDGTPYVGMSAMNTMITSIATPECLQYVCLTHPTVMKGSISVIGGTKCPTLPTLPSVVSPLYSSYSPLYSSYPIVSSSYGGIPSHDLYSYPLYSMPSYSTSSYLPTYSSSIPTYSTSSYLPTYSSSYLPTVPTLPTYSTSSYALPSYVMPSYSGGLYGGANFYGGRFGLSGRFGLGGGFGGLGTFVTNQFRNNLLEPILGAGLTGTLNQLNTLGLLGLG